MPDVTVTAQTPGWVDEIAYGSTSILLARGTSADTQDAEPQFISGPAVGYQRDRALVVQLDLGGGDAGTLASLSLADAQSIPTVIGR